MSARRIPRLWPLALAALLTACGGPRRVVSYAPPGPPADPWGPYIEGAAARFAVPQRWIRAVMRQESGGHQYLHGRLTTSSSGAVGLMQIKPATYSGLARKFGLGPDPYEPHDNIFAGTGLIRDLYDQYGAPAFLAAYQAGPRRVDAYLAGTGTLNETTLSYVAAIAPALGQDPPLTGPLAVYGGQGAAVQIAEAGQAPERRFAIIPEAHADTRPAPASPGEWAVQVGAFSRQDQARDRAMAVRAHASALAATRVVLGIASRPGGQVLYRARLLGLSAQAAATACADLGGQGQDCITVPPGG